ncbi:hypothetical protein OCA23_30345 [Bacillus cereus]|nr:hypothetical protein [Bacillus cereus]
MVAVDVPGQEKTPEEIKKEEQRKKAAARKRNSRAAAKAKQSAPPMSGEQLKVFIVTASSIASARPGMEMWKLSMEEADQLVTPLSNLMAKSEVGEAFGEYADHIALVIACFSIFIPKFMMWKATREVQQIDAKRIQDSGRTGKNETGKTGASSGATSGESTSNGAFDGKALSSLIPATGSI